MQQLIYEEKAPAEVVRTPQVAEVRDPRATRNGFKFQADEVTGFRRRRRQYDVVPAPPVKPERLRRGERHPPELLVGDEEVARQRVV
jgi:hypothetical protein